MAGAAFETIAGLEVLLRNAIDTALANHVDEQGRGIPWFLCRPPANQLIGEAVEVVRNRLIPQSRDTRHQIVAGLSFGFWSGMLGPKYEDLWRTALRLAFPGSSGARKQVAAEVEAVRKFRNRLAHHDSMLNVDIPFEMRRVTRVADFLGPDPGAWLRQTDRTADVYATRPSSPADTVVVPAKDAWPFYEENFAYICQSGRWFRPVDRFAFYADQEVKAEVPRVTHRRDNVRWNPHEQARLADSEDRNDRKIAALISVTLTAGWTEGTYQVFLLTRPGDPEHRTLPRPVAHRTSGRGSAFVQRQRYVSLHGLETSDSTSAVVPTEP